MDGGDQVPSRSIPASDAPPIRRRLKPYWDRADNTVYSKWVPTKTVEDWSRFVREAYWRKEGRSWWLGDLEMGYSRFGKAAEGDGGEMSGSGAGVESFGPEVSAEKGRNAAVMFRCVLGCMESLEVVGVKTRGIRSVMGFILVHRFDFCLYLGRDSSVNVPAL